MKHLAILGSTGSIGTSCLDVVRAHREHLTIEGLTAHRNWELLARQCDEFRPRQVALGDASLAEDCPRNRFPGVPLGFGQRGIEEIASSPHVDFVVSSIVGAAGLRGTWAAVECGKTIGLANKETLVVAGPLMTQRLRESGATLIPIDSEHNAVFQALQCGRREHVRRIILTASGGPFRGYARTQLERVTPESALTHPTWNMGRKITIDSATMMNKALEVIEARWLFDLDVDQIDVVIHPQSIVHSMVEFNDGSVIAQMSPPDMRLPIQYALTYPERAPGITPRLNFGEAQTLEFIPPDRELFPALDLGFEVARRGGTCGAVLNAANEIAVSRFLDGDLTFVDIPRVCRDVLDSHDFDPRPTLDELFRQDRWARQETLQWKP
ncbi:MAG: 1-deoxy-D-xylulose-5-phosphate reductoisomerase [Planctomycetaceae bacterium]|nr:1-deoxy-D-xylulose-5-phosphate reductoisomerase [Planctomycetaceae bacterium]